MDELKRPTGRSRSVPNRRSPADGSHIGGSRYLNKRNVLRLLALLVLFLILIDYALHLW